MKILKLERLYWKDTDIELELVHDLLYVQVEKIVYFYPGSITHNKTKVYCTFIRVEKREFMVSETCGDIINAIQSLDR